MMTMNLFKDWVGFCLFLFPCDILCIMCLILDNHLLIIILFFFVNQIFSIIIITAPGIYLLNSLACHVDGEQKTLVGDLGAIDKLITLIESRLNRGVCDEVMEIAWSTMWNVTGTSQRIMIIHLWR